MGQKLIPYVHSDGKTWDYFFVDTKTQIIQFERRINSKKHKFSTGVKYPEGTKAKRFANAELEKRLGKKKLHVRTLIKEELSPWELYKESEGWSYDTMNNIRRARRQIEEYWGDKLPSEINRDSFAEWCSWWSAKHPDIQMENAIKYFNNFCRYLHEKVINGQALLPSLVRFKDPKRHEIRAKRALKKERVFSHDEFLKIHSTAANEVEALVVHIMYTMATRIDETLKLDFGGRILLDTDPPLYRWTVGNNKAKKIGEHALHSSLVEPLEALRVRRQSEGTVLLFPQKMDNQKPLREQLIDWNAWRGRANIGWHWTPHTFKHTCLTNLFNDPRNPQAVICKQYRTSLQVALETYVKVTRESMLAMRDSIEVTLLGVGK